MGINSFASSFSGYSWYSGQGKSCDEYLQAEFLTDQFILHKNELSINVDKNGEIAWGTADVIFQIKGSNEKKHHMWETVVFEKIDGEWKIVQALAAPALNVKEE